MNTPTPCEYRPHVARFATAAAKERVSLKDTPTTRWFRIGDMAVAGLLALPGGRYRIRGVFVDKPYRGMGLGTALTEHLIALATAEHAGLEAFALNPPFYLARGFHEAGRNAHGVVRVMRDGV